MNVRWLQRGLGAKRAKEVAIGGGLTAAPSLFPILGIDFPILGKESSAPVRRSSGRHQAGHQAGSRQAASGPHQGRAAGRGGKCLKVLGIAPPRPPPPKNIFSFPEPPAAAKPLYNLHTPDICCIFVIKKHEKRRTSSSWWSFDKRAHGGLHGAYNACGDYASGDEKDEEGGDDC